MNKHIYLRAYMAGIVLPTMFLLVIMTVYIVLRYVYRFPVLVERFIVFPMAVLPNIWGLWNMLYLALRERRRLPLGLHGAALVFLVAPLGFLVARILDFPVVNFVASIGPVVFPIGLVLYYLAWKYLVGFFNAELGIA